MKNQDQEESVDEFKALPRNPFSSILQHKWSSDSKTAQYLFSLHILKAAVGI